MLVIREPGQLSRETLVGIFAAPQVAMRLKGRRIHQRGTYRWQGRTQAVKDCEPMGVNIALIRDVAVTQPIDLRQAIDAVPAAEDHHA